MNYNHIKLKSIFLILVCYTFQLFAQQSRLNFTPKYQHAVELYQNRLYNAAQQEFLEIAQSNDQPKEMIAKATYYDVICSIKLNHRNANKKAKDFIQKYPNNNQTNNLLLDIGNYYFENQQTAKSLEWYKKVNKSLLTKKTAKELNFRMGYGFLTVGKLDKSKFLFSELLNDNTYGTDAKYYYGYIAYKQKDYNLAQTTLSKLNTNNNYQKNVDYYLLDINFKAGKFEKCVIDGLKLLKKSSRKELSNINKIIGESYFNLKKYDKALPYLLKYKGKKRRWKNTDYYQVGYIYYHKKMYEKAINYFNKIIGESNFVGQNAYYHLAQCYLSLDKKSEALNAFKNASELNYDKKIQEDAFLNYAKLSYEQGNTYQSTPLILKEFLQKYPKSKNYREINELLVSAYIKVKDYDGALNYLNENSSIKNQELKKEILWYKGIDFYNNKTYKKAINSLTKSADSKNKDVSSKSKYWLAQSYYKIEQYNDALTNFESISASHQNKFENLNYNIAYCYFMLKQYNEAKPYFENFIYNKNHKENLKNDAIARLADCYFGTKNYDEAIVLYNRIIKNNLGNTAYAKYQKAMSYGLTGNKNLKINSLLSIINSSKENEYKDDALFQLGNTYANLDQNAKSHNTYEQLIRNYQNSSYLPSAMLRDGLLYYKENQYNKAINRYKLITKQFPGTKQAMQAVSNAKLVYLETGNIEEYASWAKSLKFTNITESEIENSTFESAENKFLDAKVDDAIKGFKKYLNKFPQGNYYLKANNYLAKLYEEKQEEEKAIPYYQNIIQTKNEFVENALVKLSEKYLQNSKISKAISLLERLELEANYRKNIEFAQKNLMKAYYDKENYEKAIVYAEKVLNSHEENTADAEIIIARASFKNSNYTKAEKYFNAVSKSATGKIKAEALYYKSFFENIKKQYKISNTTVEKLIANYSNYKYWSVKAYVIMAKNYYALNDAYQATFILENIIKNFTQFEDIIQEAKSELKKIKSKESETNSSIK